MITKYQENYRIQSISKDDGLREGMVKQKKRWKSVCEDVREVLYLCVGDLYSGKFDFAILLNGL